VKRVLGTWPLALVALALAACDSSKLLGPEAAQGIDGIVWIGPQCPVESPEDPCPDLPYVTTIEILDREQYLVTTLESGTDGKFRVGLEPGLYIIVPKQFDPYPIAAEQIASVSEGVWTAVTVNYDTGIR
jgi:hypothetical protein